MSTEAADSHAPQQPPESGAQRPRPVAVKPRAAAPRRPADKGRKAAVAPAGDRERDPVKDRLSIPVTVDRSRFAYEVMQDKTKEELRQVLTDPGLPAALGLAPMSPGGAPLTESWDGDFLNMVFDGAGGAFVFAGEQRGLTLTKEHVAALAFSDGQRKQLGAPLQRVLDKWFPGGFGKWNDEVLLLVFGVMIIKGKFDLLNQIAAEQRGAARPAPSAPMVETPEHVQ